MLSEEPNNGRVRAVPTAAMTEHHAANETPQNPQVEQGSADAPDLDQLLIVDDDEQIRNSLERLLRRRGHTCLIAEDATMARGILETNKVSLMLSDVNMPGESGLALAESVLANYPGMAVLMVTGEDDPALAARALELGAYGYIIKPFKPSELLINVANALRRRALELENRRHTQVLEQTVEARTADLRRAITDLEGVTAGATDRAAGDDPSAFARRRGAR